MVFLIHTELRCTVNHTPINLFQVIKYLHYRFLNTLRRVRKIAESDCQLRYGCLSVRVGQRGSHWRFFVKCGYSSFFENSFIHSAVCLTTGPKAPPPTQALHKVRSSASFLQMTVSSPFLKVIQKLPTSSSSPSCHFYPPFYLSFNNLL